VSVVELDRDELRAAVFALSTLTRERRLAGRGCPKEVVALRDRLEREWRHPSPTRQQRGAAREEWDADATRIGTATVARRLGWSTRRVQRHADMLGGQMIGGRLVFRTRDVQAYAERNRLTYNGSEEL